ncbi:MAG: carboxypeptidase regulatory-like domain-containing protein, partial [Planctomycetes bacterium]|nr:carboxypeptidase regulatory-like domain-containing protein [Planctomycetota bacterium]
MILAGLALLCASAGESPRLRVVDARDGRPIVGATVELWTEDGVRPRIVATRLATLRTGADGTSSFEYKIDGVRADVARVTRPGFASVSVSSGDLEDGVALEPALPLTGRVVDLEGLPVANARLFTPGMCRHAVAGAEARSGPDGVFRFEDLGADGELHVAPEAHTPLESLAVATLRRLAARDGSVDVFVAPRAPIRVRMLDRDGRPMPQRRVHSNAELFAAAWTDHDGWALLPPVAQGEATLTVFDGEEELQVDGSFVPRDGIFVAQPFAHRRSDAAGRLTVLAQLAAAGTPPPSVVVFARDGAHHQATDLAGIATGPATVFVGQDFSPWREQRRQLEVTEEPQTVVVDALPSRRVRVLLTRDDHELLVIQAASTGWVTGSDA